MGYIKRSKYLHYSSKSEIKKMDLDSGLDKYPKENELTTYFLPQESRPESQYDIRIRKVHTPHFSRFKNSGYANGYGMGHFNRYSTSEAEHGVGIHPKGVAPPEYYDNLDQPTRSAIYEESFHARQNS